MAIVTFSLITQSVNDTDVSRNFAIRKRAYYIDKNVRKKKKIITVFPFHWYIVFVGVMNEVKLLMINDQP